MIVKYVLLHILVNMRPHASLRVIRTDDDIVNIIFLLAVISTAMSSLLFVQPLGI